MIATGIMECRRRPGLCDLRGTSRLYPRGVWYGTVVTYPPWVGMRRVADEAGYEVAS
jgi:hypothetical protein